MKCTNCGSSNTEAKKVTIFGTYMLCKDCETVFREETEKQKVKV